MCPRDRRLLYISYQPLPFALGSDLEWPEIGVGGNEEEEAVWMSTAELLPPAEAEPDDAKDDSLETTLKYNPTQSGTN